MLEHKSKDCLMLKANKQQKHLLIMTLALVVVEAILA